MPPAPPNSRTRRKVLSLPASTARPSIGPSSSSLACLTATMLSILASSREQLGVDVDDHPRGDVVHHHRQLRNRRGDRFEVGAQAGPVGLVVVGRDDQRGVGAGVGGHLGQLARVAGVVGAGAADQQRVLADLGPHRAEQLDRLLVGQGRALAGGAADDQPVRAVLEQVRGEPPRRVRVDRPVLVERRRHRRDHASRISFIAASGYASRRVRSAHLEQLLEPDREAVGQVADLAHREHHARA